MASTRPAAGQQVPQRLDRDVVWHVSGDYLLYLPEEYDDGDEKWPLMVFLHGAGERGSDLEMVKRHGPPKLIAEGQKLPFIVASPQVPEGQRWDVDFITGLIDELEEKYRVDEERIYLTGLSMGGFGTWALGSKDPGRFAAIAPVCGGGDPRNVCALKDTPTWVFHGSLDQVVPLERSSEMVRALESCGGKVRFTVYPTAGHDSWTETYANPEFYEWLLMHRLDD